MLLSKIKARKNRGVLSLDTAFSLVVIIGLAAYVQAKADPLSSKNDEAVVVDAITHIIEGAKNFKAGQSDGYTTLTMTQLVDLGLVPQEFDDVGGSAVGGSYTVSNPTSSSYDLSIDSMDEGLCNRVSSKMGRFITVDGSDCSTTGTLVINVGA